MIRLSRKFIKRSVIGLALLAPIVYLFGSQFFALNGAHGEEVFAEPVYTNQFVEVDNYVNDGSTYRLEIGNDYLDWCSRITGSYVTYTFSFDFGGVTRSGWSMGFYNNSYYFCLVRTGSSQDQFFRYTPSTSSLELTRPFPWILTSSEFPIPFMDVFLPASTLYKSVPVPTEVVPENNSAYTDYIFDNMFGRSNFLTEWGEDAISDNPHGFAPFGTLLKTIDDNVLHLSNEQIGLMGYGYFYYCAHVLIFAFMFECATFFISWCSSIFNKFGGKDNGD